MEIEFKNLGELIQIIDVGDGIGLYPSYIKGLTPRPRRIAEQQASLVKRKLEEHVKKLFDEQFKEQKAFFRQVIGVTPYNPDQFKRRQQGMKFFYNPEGEPEGKHPYKIHEIYQRTKALISELDKEIIVYDKASLRVGDKVGLTVLVSSPNVPQYNFLEIYRRKSMDDLIGILKKDNGILLSDKKFKYLLTRARKHKKNADLFESLFRKIYGAYGRIYEPENERALLAFNTDLQVGLEKEVIKLLPFRFSFDGWIDLKVESQTYYGPNGLVVKADFIEPLNEHHVPYVMEHLNRFYRDLLEKKKSSREDEERMSTHKCPEQCKEYDSYLLVYDNRVLDREKEGASLFVVSKDKKSNGKIIHISGSNYNLNLGPEQLEKFLEAAKLFADKLIANNGPLFYKDLPFGWASGASLDKEARDMGSERLIALLAEQSNMRLIPETYEQVWGKDYQSKPKENGYKAIHQRLVGHPTREIQIRTLHQEFWYWETRAGYEQGRKEDIPAYIERISKKNGKARERVKGDLTQVYRWARETDDSLRLGKIREWAEEAKTNPDKIYDALDLLDRLRLYHVAEEIKDYIQFMENVKANLMQAPTSYLRRQGINARNEEHVSKAQELTDVLWANAIFKDERAYERFRKYLPALAETFSHVAYLERIGETVKREIKSKRKVDKLKASALFSLYDLLIEEAMRGRHKDYFAQLDDDRKALKSDTFLDATTFYLVRGEETGIITALSKKKGRYDLHKSLNNLFTKLKKPDALNICIQALCSYMNSHYNRDDIKPANFTNVEIK